MNARQKRRLIEALRIRESQISLQIQGLKTKYPITEMHHLRDIMTIKAALIDSKDFHKLLANLPIEADLV